MEDAIDEPEAFSARLTGALSCKSEVLDTWQHQGKHQLAALLKKRGQKQHASHLSAVLAARIQAADQVLTSGKCSSWLPSPSGPAAAPSAADCVTLILARHQHHHHHHHHHHHYRGSPSSLASSASCPPQNQVPLLGTLVNCAHLGPNLSPTPGLPMSPLNTQASPASRMHSCKTSSSRPPRRLHPSPSTKSCASPTPAPAHSLRCASAPAAGPHLHHPPFARHPSFQRPDGATTTLLAMACDSASRTLLPCTSKAERGRQLNICPLQRPIPDSGTCSSSLSPTQHLSPSKSVDFAFNPVDLVSNENSQEDLDVAARHGPFSPVLALTKSLDASFSDELNSLTPCRSSLRALSGRSGDLQRCKSVDFVDCSTLGRTLSSAPSARAKSIMGPVDGALAGGPREDDGGLPVWKQSVPGWKGSEEAPLKPSLSKRSSTLRRPSGSKEFSTCIGEPNKLDEAWEQDLEDGSSRGVVQHTTPDASSAQGTLQGSTPFVDVRQLVAERPHLQPLLEDCSEVMYSGAWGRCGAHLRQQERQDLDVAAANPAASTWEGLEMERKANRAAIQRARWHYEAMIDHPGAVLEVPKFYSAMREILHRRPFFASSPTSSVPVP